MDVLVAEDFAFVIVDVDIHTGDLILDSLNPSVDRFGIACHTKLNSLDFLFVDIDLLVRVFQLLLQSSGDLTRFLLLIFEDIGRLLLL